MDGLRGGGVDVEPEGGGLDVEPEGGALDDVFGAVEDAVSSDRRGSVDGRWIERF